MARKKARTHQVHETKNRRNTVCGTITVADQLRMERVARRKQQIDSGIDPRSGSGAHGPDKRQKRRLERREGRRLSAGENSGS